MTRRPQADLDALTVPKGDSAPQTATSEPPGREMKVYAHTLSLRLTGEQYRRLRRYVAAQEEATGQRIPEQSIIERALTVWLDNHGG